MSTDRMNAIEFGAVAQIIDPISRIVSAARYTILIDDIEYNFPKRS